MMMMKRHREWVNYKKILKLQMLTVNIKLL